MKNTKNIENLKIKSQEKIIDALKLMDKTKRKLLIVTKDNLFYSMLSIGDIQRAIINGISLDNTIVHILRSKNNITIAHTWDSTDTIRNNILKHKAEFMPVVDKQGVIKKIYFWEDLVGFEPHDQEKLDIPMVLMAGGTGSRLRPLTNIIPKALVPLGEKPIAESIIDKFNQVGIQKFYLSIYHKSEMIKRYFDELPNKQYEIEYIHEEKPLGTAGSLYHLKNIINTTFFVSNCDVLIDQDYREVYRYHKENKNDMTLVSALMHYSIPYGIIKTGNSGVLYDIDEKPEITYQVNTGMYVLEPHVLDEIPHNEFFHITQLIKEIKEKQGKIGVFPVSQKSWLDIGVWKKYEDSINEFKNWMNF
ncbi:MAG: sugar phosphate nucleotidyltransferase [Candidatus Woesearchaeota archaeon]